MDVSAPSTSGGKPLDTFVEVVASGSGPSPSFNPRTADSMPGWFPSSRQRELLAMVEVFVVCPCNELFGFNLAVTVLDAAGASVAPLLDQACCTCRSMSVDLAKSGGETSLLERILNRTHVASITSHLRGDGEIFCKVQRAFQSILHVRI